MATVRLEHVHKSFGDIPVLHDVTLTIADGELLVFVGPSGCGKSTLLRLIAGLDTVTSGHLWIGDDDVTALPPSKRGVSMVFQSYALYPHMTVYKNIAFGLMLAKTARETVDERVRRVAAMLGLDPLLGRKPRELSGGQRQRVAIARAIVREPRVFLFDEPLSNLDAALRAQTRVEIATMHDTLNATMIYVTHDQVEAMTLADRIVVLNHGRIEQVGTPTALYHEPANLFVAEFLGSPRMNLVPATWQHGVAALSTGQTLRLATQPSTQQAAIPITVGVRPEDVHLTSDAAGDAGIPITISFVEELGETRLVHGAAMDGTPIVLRDRSEPPPRKGDRRTVVIDVGKCHLFDAAGQRMPKHTE